VDYVALGWYLSIFAWLYFTGIGIPPCPEEAGILYAASVTASTPEVRWWLAWPAAGLGIICADTTLYGLGRWWGPRLFEYRWVRRIVKPDRRRRIEDRFKKHGLKLLLTARLLPPLRTGVFLLAGALRYSFATFLLADAIYAVVGVGLFFFLGTGLVELLHRLGHWGWYLAAGAVVLYLLYRYYRYLQAREAKGDAPPVSVLEVVVPEEPTKGPPVGTGLPAAGK
jgi:membrane protein DedA with SNARE-associated domain